MLAGRDANESAFFVQERIMHRRELLGVLGSSAVGLVAVSSARAEDDADKAIVDCGCKCVEACCDAMNWCNEAYLHCSRLVAKGNAENAKAMALLLDCGEVCGTAAKLVARMSPLTVQLCRTCLEGCELCVAECSKLDGQTMKDAVKSLRACGESCRAMLKVMGEKA